MGILLYPAVWLSAALTFCLRVTDMTLDTLRVLFVMRGRMAANIGPVRRGFWRV